MARPTKQGIDYFPIDTEFDDDLQLLITEIGAEGLGILLTIWQAIYKANGYYIKCDDKFPLKIKQKCFSCVENVVNVVGKSIDFEIFDKDMYDNFHILTSRGIQKRYFTASRAKKQIEIIPEFILIDVSRVDNIINVVGNGVLNGRNATKEKEKEKEKKKKKGIVLPSWLDKKLWTDYKDHRKSMKAPLTPKGEELAINKLQKLYDAGQDINDIIEQTIMNGWKGFFEKKTGGNYGSGRGRIEETWKRNQDAEAEAINEEYRRGKAAEVATNG